MHYPRIRRVGVDFGKMLKILRLSFLCDGKALTG